MTDLSIEVCRIRYPNPFVLASGPPGTNGKVIKRPKGAWNLYAEYQTSLIYDDWPGAAVENSIRLNFTLTLPVGM